MLVYWEIKGVNSYVYMPNLVNSYLPFIFKLVYGHSI